MIANNKQILHKTVTDLIAHLTNEGWTINKNKVKRPAEFLGVHWSIRGPSFPPEVSNKLRNLPKPQNKAETQHLIGLFGYWRQHITYLQLLLQPLYSRVKKASDFTWGPTQGEAVKIIL